MRVTRLMLAAVAAASLASAPAGALAHAELVSSSPAAGAQLDEPPRVVTLTFEGELQPDGSGFTITRAGAGEVGAGSLDLDVAERNVISGELTITQPGLYLVAWTVVALDGHGAAGELSFRYDDAGSAPDTALPAPEGPRALVVVGGLLVALSFFAAAWAALRRARER